MRHKGRESGLEDLSSKPAGGVVHRARRGATPAYVSGHEKGSSRQDGYSASLAGDQIQLAQLLYSALFQLGPPILRAAANCQTNLSDLYACISTGRGLRASSTMHLP